MILSRLKSYSLIWKKNSVPNKVFGLTNLVFEHVDILVVAETKLDTSFLPLMSGFYKPFRLDVTKNSWGLLVYDKRSLPARELQDYKLPFDIQSIPFEINLRRRKWLFIGLNKPRIHRIVNTAWIF